MEEGELAAARAAAEAEFNSRKPDETPGSEDTDIHGAHIRTPRRVAFAVWMKNLVDDLVADASGDSAAALARCRRTLLVQPLMMIVSDQVRQFFENLTIHFLEWCQWLGQHDLMSAIPSQAFGCGSPRQQQRRFLVPRLARIAGASSLVINSQHLVFITLL